MKQWNPAPRELVLELLKTRWDRKNPAPQIVVWHWAWHILDGGGTVSRRDVEAYAGWTGWKASKLLQEVKANYAEWQGYPAKPTETNHKPTTNQPDAPVITDSCEPKPTTNQPQTNHLRARDPSYTPKPLHPTENTIKSDKPKDAVATAWDRMLEVRSKHRPKTRGIGLTASRRRMLKARLKEHTVDDLLLVTEWHFVSNHPNATWNREQGNDLDTLIRPANFDRYLLHATNEGNQTFTPAPPKREGITEMLKRRDRERDGLNVVTFPFTPSRETTNGNQ